MVIAWINQEINCTLLIEHIPCTKLYDQLYALKHLLHVSVLPMKIEYVRSLCKLIEHFRNLNVMVIRL